MNSKAKAVNKALDAASEQGYAIRTTADQHIQVKNPNTGAVATIAGKPGGPRGVKNALSELRKIGVEMNDRPKVKEGKTESSAEQGTLAIVECKPCDFLLSWDDKKEAELISKTHRQMHETSYTQNDRILMIMGVAPQREWSLYEIAELAVHPLATHRVNRASASLSNLLDLGYVTRPRRAHYKLEHMPDIQPKRPPKRSAPRTGGGVPVAGVVKPPPLKPLPQPEPESKAEPEAEPEPEPDPEPEPKHVPDTGALCEVRSVNESKRRMLIQDENGKYWIAYPF